MNDKEIKEILKKYRASVDFDDMVILYRILEKIQCNTILEIGFGFGGTFKLFSTLLNGNSLLIGIDPHWHINWLNNHCMGKRGFPRLPSLNKNKCRIKTIQNKSQDVDAVDYLYEILFKENRMLDFLFIDGDCSEQATLSDYRYYSPAVRKGAIICFRNLNKAWNSLRGDKYEISNNLGYMIKEVECPTRYRYLKKK